jgi:hypothetical protein
MGIPMSFPFLSVLPLAFYVKLQVRSGTAVILIGPLRACLDVESMEMMAHYALEANSGICRHALQAT